MPIRELSLAVVGVDYPNKKRGPTRRFAIELCRPGDPIELRPEPNNPADPRAVAVYNASGMQLGYVTAERAPWIGGMLRDEDRAVRAIFQNSFPQGAWIRVTLDGSEPLLPAIPLDRPKGSRGRVIDARADPESGFYPDEIPPDE